MRPVIRHTLGIAGFCLALPGPAAGHESQLEHEVNYRNYFGAMTFNRPLAFAQYPGEDSAYIVVEQVGKLRTVERRNGAWAKTDSAVLQVPVVNSTAGNKCAVPQNRATSSGITAGYYESRGLLGFAFHPAYRQNRRYYVSYVTVRDSSGSTQERTIVAERIAGESLRPRTEDSSRVLLDFCQPGWDHKGGHIAFGPDGMLYYASGDGGNQDLWNSPNNPSLRRDSWLGKILRIDVDGVPDAGKAYRVPPDNPFIDSAGFLPEVWAWGLRNPWKWHFHPGTGDLWLGNVGYTNRDNIYRIHAGAYLGWPIWEGNHCSTAGDLNGMCAGTSASVLRPVIDLLHNSEARSVTGGTFFLGDTTAPFHNAYFFGDYIYNWVRVVRLDPGSGAVIESRNLEDIQNVVSFDRDSLGRIFAVSLGAGTVTSNTGVVYILESPGFEPLPVGLRRRPAAVSVQALSRAQLLRDRHRYDFFSPDGRKLSGIPAGIFLVREKGGTAPPILMMPDW